MGFDRWREARNEPKELDLVPIMNLMVVLIPFLMLGAAFYHVAVIPASLPAKVDVVSAPPADTIKVTAQLELDANGHIHLSASAATLDPETLARFAAELPPTPAGADLPQLVRRLQALKAQYPKSDTLLVLPEGDLSYQQLVAALDAAREIPGATEDDPATPLFPVAVFSKKIIAPEPVEGPDGGVAPEEAP
jgi:biopolymer transport protein ExbD